MKPRVHGAAELTVAQIYILLGGWGAKLPAGVGNEGLFALGGQWGVAAPRADDGVFDLFQGQDAGIVRVWRRYEQFLRSEAQRLGITPPYVFPDGRQLFYGEFAALPAAEQWAYEQAQPEADDE